MPLFSSLLDRLLDLLYPPRCVGCCRTGVLLCAACRAALTPYEEPLPPLPPLCAAYVGYVFDGTLRGAVHRLKYRRQQCVALVLAELLQARLGGHLTTIDAVLPVPLHPSRLRERGFNQSELIAASLARSLHLPLLGGLVRKEATRSQVGLDGRERRQNVANAFVWRGACPPPRQLLLIDDVLTTGATLQACAQALIAAGAASVTAAAVARSRLTPLTPLSCSLKSPLTRT